MSLTNKILQESQEKRTMPVIAIGVVNITTGKTAHDWSIYENPGLWASLTSGGYLIFGGGGGEKTGSTYELIANDSRRNLNKRGEIISSHSCEDKESFIQWLKSFGYDYTPIRAYTKRPAGNKKLSTSYVLK